MKNSQETSMNKGDAAAPEESSWTSYFEEFSWQNDQDMIMSCDETLVSDAASSVKKAACIQDDHAKKLRLLKKRKTKGVMIIDDSLEDTATSPVNSPKVSYVKIKNKNDKTPTHRSEEKLVGTCEEENKRRVVHPNMELKKRGLCLVPLSSLANYLS